MSHEPDRPADLTRRAALGVLAAWPVAAALDGPSVATRARQYFAALDPAAAPQLPQFFGSVAVSDSHPFDATPSQFPYPAAHPLAGTVHE